MPIKILSEDVASQIAAGEVVERPASVVKELIENALDAGANEILVFCEGAGQKLIRVEDDGSGIPASEITLAVTRHATSKLSTAKELFQVETLGFRGEALASIGSVSQMTVTSRETKGVIGVSLRVEGGKTTRLDEVGSPHGTVIVVENLFYNVPARKKFLKTDLTERRHIDEVVTQYAIAYPNVRFTLNQEEKISLKTTGSGDRREILATIYGVDIARQMLEMIASEGDVDLSGLISPVSLTRSNRKAMQFYVNRRPVQDITLSTALLQGYRTLLMVGRYPYAHVFLEIPPDQVDVNVHPTKAEVRFRERDVIFSAVQRSVRKALLAYTPIPELRSQYRWGQFDETNGTRGSSPIGTDPQKSTDPVFSSQFRTDINEIEDVPQVQSLPGPRVPLLRLIGQIATAYLIAEGPDGLYLIDQHAAHERVLFEKFLANLSDPVPSQRLLEPVAVELTPANSRLLSDQLDVLRQIGFEVEIFGRNTYLVRTVPGLLSGMDPAAALRVVVEEFEEDETPLQGKKEQKIIARVCKRAAVKAGQVLSDQEQKALLRDLELTDSPRTCPHGRPTMIHLSVDLLERQFGRKGAR